MAVRQFGVQMFGLDALLEMVEDTSIQLPVVMGESFYKEGQDILADSRELVPFLTGALSSSGRVHDPYYVGNTVAVEVTYGGSSGGGVNVNYAIPQHENETFVHAEGRQAFYLLDPLQEHLQGMGVRLLANARHIISRNIARQVQEAQSEERGGG